MSSYVLRTTGNIELSAGSTSTITLNCSSVSAPALSLTTALPVSSGGTGSTTASDARTALGLAIGSNVQEYNAKLADISGLAPTSGQVISWNGTNFTATTPSAGSSLVVGVDVQAYNAKLSDISGLTLSTGDLIKWNGTNFASTPSSNFVNTSDDATLSGTITFNTTKILANLSQNQIIQDSSKYITSVINGNNPYVNICTFENNAATYFYITILAMEEGVGNGATNIACAQFKHEGVVINNNGTIFTTKQINNTSLFNTTQNVIYSTPIACTSAVNTVSLRTSCTDAVLTAGSTHINMRYVISYKLIINHY